MIERDYFVGMLDTGEHDALLGRDWAFGTPPSAIPPGVFEQPSRAEVIDAALRLWWMPRWDYERHTVMAKTVV